jgi:pyruvate dehydrogenase E2 component (dihydrolipoyllysine-residue acetyltransferase)
MDESAHEALPEGARARVAVPSVSPAVRRVAEDLALDLASITGTGDGGRITRRDVIEAADARGLLATPTPGAADRALTVSTPSSEEASSTTAPGHETVVPMSPIRRRIAEHMLRSKVTSPPVMAAVETDFENIETVRSSARASWNEAEGFSLTYLPFVARAVCDTLGAFPNINSSVVNETLVVHDEVHLAIAVDLEFEGLIAPVVRSAGGKRLQVIAREVRDLAARARRGELTPDDLVGGTFTITNPGPEGCDLSVPIINQPQTAILATNAIRKEARVVDGPDGLAAIAVRRVGTLSLSWDHRAFDGAYGSAFLDSLRVRLEEHDWSSELD